jgi:pimeloyl-ACP methyl ester carboxylesterase
MMATVGGKSVHFEQAGRGEDVLLLHGWGVDGKSLLPIARHLASRWRVSVPDLPGFGESPPPEAPWGTADYAELVRGFLDDLGIERAHLVAHSFGGRIALYLSAHWPERVGRLLLVDSAGLRPRRTLRFHLRVGTFKLARGFLRLPLWGIPGSRLVDSLAKRFGSRDYQSASGTMRGTLVRVVNEDLRHLLPSIVAPTLLVWGGDDTETPVRDAYVMEKLIPRSRLIVYPGAGHFSYLDRQPQFLRTLEAFLARGSEGVTA